MRLITFITTCILASTVYATPSPALLAPQVEEEVVLVEPEVPELLQEYHMFGAFEWYPQNPTALMLVSSVYDGLEIDFEQALWTKPEITTIVLASPGGRVKSALRVAQIINDKGLNTYVPEGSKCESACAFMFMSGKNRMAKGKLGVHNISSDSTNQTDFRSAFRGVQKMIGFTMLNLDRYDTPKIFWIAMLMTEAERMYHFNARELDEINRGEASPAHDVHNLVYSVRDTFVTALNEYREKVAKK